MTTTTQTTAEPLIRWAALTFLAQVTITAIHHVYGGLVYDSMLRLSQPILAGIESLLVLGLLFWYKQTGSRISLTIYSVVIALVGVVQGLFHTLYGHAYKDILFLAGVSADNVRNYFLPLMPNDFIYPPNDIFFEITGVIQLVTIYLLTSLTYRLIRKRQTRE